jgi:hypothetical protein
MSDLDKARVLRLKGTVDAQLAVKASVMSGEALSLAAVEAAGRVRRGLPRAGGCAYSGPAWARAGR